MNISEKIAALINKAQSTDSQAEADALMSKAQQLMRENNLSYSDVENVGNEIEREYVDYKGWKAQLFIALAHVNNCTTLVGRKGRSIVGEKQTIQTVKFLHEFYTNCLKTLSENYYRNNPYGSKLSIKANYCNGAVVGLRTRLKKETEQHEIATPELTGIIHVKKEAVSQWIAKELGKIGTRTQRIGCTNYSAFQQGKADAQTIRTNSKQLA